MSDQEEYLPFHAINEFMRDDYRITVITEVLSKLDAVDQEKRAYIGRLISKFVHVQGFRNSNMAPVGLKAKGSVTLFEHSPEYVALIIECWRSLHEELAKSVFAVLSEHNWENLPALDVDRCELSGFQIHWPKEDNFETLIKAAKEKNPELQESEDNISLMAVWLGNRLPYDLYIEDSKVEEK